VRAVEQPIGSESRCVKVCNRRW